MGTQLLHPRMLMLRPLPLAVYLECCFFQLLGLGGHQFQWQESHPAGKRIKFSCSGRTSKCPRCEQQIRDFSLMTTACGGHLLHLRPARASQALPGGIASSASHDALAGRCHPGRRSDRSQPEEPREVSPVYKGTSGCIGKFISCDGSHHRLHEGSFFFATFLRFHSHLVTVSLKLRRS